jgi:uncharacterized membrane protein
MLSVIFTFYIISNLIKKFNIFDWLIKGLYYLKINKMKTQIFGRITLVLFMLFSFLACEKDTEDSKKDNEDNSAQIDIKSLVEEAGNRYLSGEVILSENNESLHVESGGLIDEYTADERGLKEDRPQNTFLVCVKSVEPDREQRMKLSRAFSAYSTRNERIIRAHRENMHNLEERMKTARNQLYLSFEAGEINREQYRNRMQALRERYQEAVNRIRVSNVEAFSRSYSLMLEHLQLILSQEQWKSFTSCISA